MIEPEPNSGCWLWTGHVLNSSKPYLHYGRVFVGRRGFLVHRLMWTLVHGSIPKGLDVCHRCDVPACINPAHLFLATHAENMADRNRKGRARSGPGRPRGKPVTPLTLQRVRYIRAHPDIPAKVLATRYHVTPHTIRTIRRGERWRNP